MSDRAYVFTSNGSMTWDLQNNFRPFDEQIRRTLSQLGSRHSTLLFWALPEGDKNLGDSDAEPQDQDVYLQAAGTAEQMTIEVQEKDSDGQIRHFILGHGPVQPGEPEIVIAWEGGAHHVTISASEAFGLDEAARIFQHYFDTGTVPEDVSRRLLPDYVA